jgi:hypothetical protein
LATTVRRMVVAARSIEHLRVEEDPDDIKGVSAV